MAQTLSEGLIVPDSDGSEAISATGVAELRLLGTTTNTALQGKLPIVHMGTTGDLNDATSEGLYTYWSGVDNAPGGSGTVIVSRLLSTTGTVSGVYQLAHITSLTSPEIWSRFQGSTGWSAWVQVGGSASASAGLLPASPGSMKSAPLAMTAGFGGATVTGSGTTVVMQKLPAMVERLQIHLENRNPRSNNQDSPQVTLSNVRIGLHNGSGSSASWVTPAGVGLTPYRSAWITVPPSWRGQEIVVAYTWTSSGTIQQTIGTGWTGGAATGQVPLWAWLECAIPADVPVVAAFGDSLSVGVGSTHVMVDSWIAQWAEANDAFPAWWAGSGDASTTWTKDADRKWFQYGKTIAAPDAVIYAMGSNEVFGSGAPSYAVMQQRTRDTVALIREKLGNPVVYGATIMPRTSATDETLRRNVNAWYPYSGLFRQVFPFGTTISNDDETIIPEYDSDGIHLTTSGYGALAGIIPASIAPSWGTAITAMQTAASA